MELIHRSYIFDNMKVWLITSMVLAHYCRMSKHFGPGSGPRVIYVFVFFFLMQGFFFISGYFSKHVDKCRSGAVKNYIVPYLFFIPFYYLIRDALLGNARMHIIYPTHGLWYLLAMFAYRFFIKDLSKLNMKILLLVCVIVYFTIGAISFIGNPFGLHRIFSFLIFFMAGYACSREDINRVRKTPALPAVITLIILTAFSCFCSFLPSISNTDVGLLLLRTWDGYYGLNHVEMFISRSIIFVCAFAWIYVMIRLIPDCHFAITDIGSHTITVYMFHIFIRYFLKKFGIYGYPGPVFWSILFGLTAISVWMFSRPSIHRAYNKVIDFMYNTFCYQPYVFVRTKFTPGKIKKKW